jgi:leader peptidase (prepilin peptidase)/N-methyltransferase
MHVYEWLAAVAAGVAGMVVTFRLLADADLLPPKGIRSVRGATIGAVTLLLVLIALAPTGTPQFGAANLAAAAFALVTAPLVLIDRRDQRLPNPITYSLVAIALIFGTEAALVSGDWAGFGFALIWGAIPFVLFFVMVVASRGGVGMGDAKLAAGLGLTAARTSGRLTLSSMATGFLIGGVFALVKLLSKQATRKTQIPFGPFLLAGFWVAYLLFR